MTADTGARAGASWPQDLASLRDGHVCPACFTPLESAHCSHCGLDVGGPRAGELMRASRAAADRLEYRAEVIRLMRADSLHAQRAAAARAAASHAPAAPEPAPVPVPVPELHASAQATAPAGPPPAAPTLSAPPAPSPTPRRRSSVQMLLLIVGVSLVAVALVFFLIIAWFVAGLTFRAVVVALITLLMFGSVSLLARLTLHSTAQGVAVLAVLLVYLDIWAVQATGLFGADQVAGSRYWAISLLASAPLLLLWFRFTGMRAGSVAGFIAVPIGAGLLAWDLGAPLDQLIGFTRIWLVCVVVVAAGLVQLCAPRLGRRMSPQQPLVVERSIVLIVAAGMVPPAFAFGLFTERNQVAVPLWTLGILAVVCAAHVLLSVRRSDVIDRAVASGFSAAAGFTASAIPLDMAIRASTAPVWILWPVLASVALLLALDVLRTRARQPVRRLLFLAASAGTALPVAGALVLAGWPVVSTFVERSALAVGFRPWASPAGVLTPDDAVVQATVLLAGAAALAFAVWAVFGMARQRAVLLGALLVVAVLACVVVIPWPAVASLSYLAVAAGALLVLTAPSLRERGARLPYLSTLALVTLLVGAVAGYLLAFDSFWLWLSASVAIIGLLLGSRQIRSELAPQRPALLAAAVLFALITTAFTPVAIVVGYALPWSEAVDTGGLVALASALLLLVFSVPLGRFAGPSDRGWALTTSAVVFALALAVGMGFAHDAPAASLFLLGALLSVASAALLIGLRSNRPLVIIRRGALLLLTPLLWLSGTFALEWAFALGAQVPLVALVWWQPVLAVLTLAASLVYQLRPSAGPSGLDRALVDIGSGLVLFVGVGRVLLGYGVGFDSAFELTWLLLFAAAIGVLLAAIDESGLFNARSNRHQLGWLALALATASLWWGLADAGITAPEPYTLPLAAALLLIAALLARFGAWAGSDGIAVAALAGAGLLLGLVPSAVAGAEGSLLRPILTISIAGVILLGATIWSGRIGGAPLPGTPLRLAMIGAGGLGVVLAAGARALNTVVWAGGTTSGLFEFWVVVGAGVLVAAALADGGESRRLCTALVAVALTGAALLEYVAIAASSEVTGAAAVRAVVVVASLGAAHVLLAWLRSPSLAGWLTPLALGLAAVAALIFLARSAAAFGEVVPFEWVTVPLAAAWLASGWLHLIRTPGARSWPALGGGLALLLIPSLLADYVDSPLWRVVGLGIVAIGVLLVGLFRRLQAPFVLGSIVVLLHGFAQLWPWLSALYNPTLWWLWFGAGGVLLIAIAARYEQRVQNVRSAVAMVTALR